MLAKVHIAKKELGLSDDNYRAIMRRVTGKASSGVCSDIELHQLLSEFKRLGWKPKTSSAARASSPKSGNRFSGEEDAQNIFKKSGKPHVRKVFALWSDLARSGALTDGSRTALQAFVQRQTGIASPEWLTAPQANQVTEGLKAMLARHKERAGT